MYSTWRILELKEELKRRGASIQGKKAALVERLESYDRNLNFDSVCLNTPEQQMELPKDELFRDVNSNTTLPNLTKEQVHFYFSRFNKKTEDGLRLYESRYLLVLRSCQIGSDTFIKGLCKASMKKLQYEVNIKIQHDGSPDECMCECAAGSGKEAHCKHVAVVMFATEQMKREKRIISHEVCTQQLQSFHKPKKQFTASPLKAQFLPSKRKNSNIIFHPYDLSQVDKENYRAKVRNICIGMGSSTMPMKQMYEPANPFAILNDHLYDENPRKRLLKSLNLSSNLTAKDIWKIEKMTRGQNNNPEWHEQRKHRITASKFHTVCHLSPSKQASFAKQLLMPHTFKSRATTHGIINESVALKKYEEMLGLNTNSCGLIISRLTPYLAASPDGLLGDETIIEVKCPYASRNRPINENTVPYLYKENDILYLKKTCVYYYQIQGQLYCSERKYCNLIIFTFNEIKVIFMTRDDEFIDNMIKNLTLFYENFYKEALYQKYIIRNYK